MKFLLHDHATQTTEAAQTQKATQATMRFALLLACFLCGCARFTTTQIDYRYNDDGTIADRIKTKATCTTFMNSRSALANFKAMQSEKTQSASVGSLSQESTATNFVNALNALARIAEAVRPTP